MMAVSVDLQAYHESVGRELQAVKDRVRSLIGDAHWPSDGQYKEWLVRNVLRRHVPATVSVGQGFVHVPESWRRGGYCTHQIDVLAVSTLVPVLFREDDFFIVTPDAARGIVEVKTDPDKCELRKAVDKLAEDVGRIRDSFCGPHPMAGIFAFESTKQIRDEDVLEMLREASAGNALRAINLVALGEDRFFRFWDNGERDVHSPVVGPVWHSYKLSGLAHPYFLSNTILAVSGPERQMFENVWFPISGTKETLRQRYMSLDGTKQGDFNG